MQQVAVEGTDQRPPVRSHRSEDEEAHAVQPATELCSANATIVGDDAAQMWTRRGTFVEETLQSS
jgi:hypothetical protein